MAERQREPLPPARVREPLPPVRQREPLEPMSGGDRLKNMFIGGAKPILYGIEQAAKAHVADWTNPNPDGWLEAIKMAQESSPQLYEREMARYRATMGAREEEDSKLQELASKRSVSLAENAVKDPRWYEKVVGALGSAAALAPAAIAAAATRNPQLAIMVPGALEAAAEQGMAQRDLIMEDGMSPTEASGKTKPLFAANLALNRALPGVWGTAGRSGGRAASRAAVGAVQEGLQEGAQSLLSEAQKSQAAGRPMKVDPAGVGEEMLLGGAVGLLGEGVGIGIDTAVEYVDKKRSAALKEKEAGRADAAARLIEEADAVESGDVNKIDEIYQRAVREEATARKEAERRARVRTPLERRKEAAARKRLDQKKADRVELEYAVRVAEANRQRIEQEQLAEESASEAAAAEAAALDQAGVDLARVEQAEDAEARRRRQGTAGDMPMRPDTGPATIEQARESAGLDGVGSPVAEPQRQPERPGGQTGDYYLGTGLGGAQGVKVPKAERPTYQAEAYDSPLSAAAATYNDTGDVYAAIDQMPDSNYVNKPRSTPGQEQVLDEDGYALPGEVLDAIPDSVDAAPTWFDVGGRKAQGNIEGGQMDGPLAKHIFRPEQEVEIARGRYMDRLADRVRGVLDGLNRSQRVDLATRLENPAHNNDLDVKAIRAFLDMVRDEVNYARNKRGVHEVRKIENYVTMMRRQSNLEKLIGRGDIQAHYGTKQGREDYFNPMAQRRSGNMEGPREMDIAVLLDAYIRAAARDIFNSPVIKTREELARALDDAGKHGSAKMVREITNRVWRDMPHGVSKWFAEGGRVGQAASGLMRVGRRRLNEAALVGNLSFLVAVQPASMANTIARYGFRNAMRGFYSVFDPKFRSYAFSELRGGIEKASGQSLLREGAGGSSAVTSGGSLTPKSKYDFTMEMINVFSKELEKSLYLMSAAAGYHHATKDLGMTDPNQVKQHMNEAGNLTQQAYYRADQMGWQHSRELTALFPFLTYLFETGNTFAEVVASPFMHALTGKRLGVFKDEAYVGRSRARSAALTMKRLSSYIIAMWMWEEFWAYPRAGRRPFRDMLFGKAPAPLAPLQMYADLGEALQRSMKYETADPLLRFANRYYAPTGAQSERLRQTINAINNGGVVSRKERRNGKIVDREMFSIEGEELKSAVFGVWSTEGGKEYADDHLQGSPGWSLFTQMMESSGLDDDEDEIGGPYRQSTRSRSSSRRKVKRRSARRDR